MAAVGLAAVAGLTAGTAVARPATVAAAGLAAGGTGAAAFGAAADDSVGLTGVAVGGGADGEHALSKRNATINAGRKRRRISLSLSVTVSSGVNATARRAASGSQPARHTIVDAQRDGSSSRPAIQAIG
ncbi:MAG: hypothetical protein IT307_19075 [Chloroflexi bacterium]|nr:hypothetical protein [Chloroflexota bacterium]